jgi:hypothetical protein
VGLVPLVHPLAQLKFSVLVFPCGRHVSAQHGTMGGRGEGLAGRAPRSTLPAILAGRSLTSNCVMRRMPHSPLISRPQVACTPVASGVTTPRPVTTTLRFDISPCSQSVLIDFTVLAPFFQVILQSAEFPPTSLTCSRATSRRCFATRETQTPTLTARRVLAPPHPFACARGRTEVGPAVHR